MFAEATSVHTGKVSITEPTLGQPWLQYELEVCPSAGPPSACFSQDCGPVVPRPGATDCYLGGVQPLEAQTEYRVAVVAVQSDGTRSLEGSDTLTTPGFT